jgi:ribosomal protein S18 acetylase RimI-like enzyme
MVLHATGLRRARAEDAPALARVINRAYVVEEFFVEGARTSETDLAQRFASSNPVFLVVDDPSPSGELAAAVFVEIRGERGYFAMLAVDPRCQGSGLGRLLVTAAEDHCRVAGCTFMDIEVVNLRAELPAFYAKLGYAPYATAPFRQVERLLRPAHLVVMTKPLLSPW